MKKLLKIFRKGKHKETKRNKTEKQGTVPPQHTSESEAEDPVPTRPEKNGALVGASLVHDATSVDQIVDPFSGKGDDARSGPSQQQIARGSATKPSEHDDTVGSADVREDMEDGHPADIASPYVFDAGGYVSLSEVAEFFENNPTHDTGSKASPRCSTPIYESLETEKERTWGLHGTTGEQEKLGASLQTTAPDVPHNAVLELSGLSGLSVDSAGYLKPVREKKTLSSRVGGFFRNFGRAFVSVFTRKKSSSASRNLFDDLIARESQPNYYVDMPKFGASTEDTRSAGLEQFSEGLIAKMTVQIDKDGDQDRSDSESRNREARERSSSVSSFLKAILGTADAMAPRHTSSVIDTANPFVSLDPEQTNYALFSDEQRIEGRKDIALKSDPQQQSPSGTRNVGFERGVDTSKDSSIDDTNTHNLGNTMNDKIMRKSSIQARKEELFKQNKTSQTRNTPPVGKLSAQLLDTISRKLSFEEAPSTSKIKKSAAQGSAQDSPRVIGGIQKLKTLGGFSSTPSQRGVIAEAVASLSGAKLSPEKKKTTKSSGPESQKVVGALQRLLGRSPNAKSAKVVSKTPDVATSTAMNSPSLVDLLEGRKRLRSVSKTSSASMSQQGEPIYARSTKSSTTSHASSVFSAADSEDIAPALPPRPFFDAMYASRKEKSISSSSSDISVFQDVRTHEAKPAAVRSNSPELPATKRAPVAVKPPVAPKPTFAFKETTTLGSGQKAMHAFSSFASVASPSSTSAETKPALPATKPAAAGKSHSIAGLHMLNSQEQLGTSAKPVTVKSLSSITTDVTKAPVVTSTTNKPVMSSSSAAPTSSTSMASAAVSSSSSTNKRSRSPSPVSPTKFGAEASTLPDLSVKPRTLSRSSTSSTVSVKEQMANCPQIPTETVEKAQEICALSRVKRSTRVLKNTSPKIQQSIEMLFSDAGIGSGAVSSNTPVNAGNVNRTPVTDFTKSKQGTSTKRTPEAVNFTAIRMAQNAVMTNGERHTSALSGKSVDCTVKRMESRLLSERNGVSSAGSMGHAIGISPLISTFEKAAPKRSIPVPGGQVSALVRKFNAPQGSKVSELVRKLEGKYSAAVAAETSKQHRGR